MDPGDDQARGRVAPRVGVRMELFDRARAAQTPDSEDAVAESNQGRSLSQEGQGWQLGPVVLAHVVDSG